MNTADMTLDDSIGQLFMVGFWGTTISRDIVEMIERHRVGGIILFSRNVQDARQLRSLTHDLQTTARHAGHRVPLLIAIDQENGMVQRLGQGTTQFPGNMTLGAIGSEQVAYEVARATGRELKALGINMNLAPVVDVNNNPANPVIGVRSFSEDPHEVARLGAAAIHGYHAAGVITTLKHFPGHGDTAIDSHLALPTITHSMERLEVVELVPFRACIQAGADSVMIAHIAFPAIMQQAKLPATVSSEVIRGLLRETLGFEGVIISDCMEMKAITTTLGAQRASVMALQAGTDIVLVSHHHDLQQVSIAAVRSSIQANTLTPVIVQQAAERVLALKQRFLSWDEQEMTAVEVPTWVGGAEHRQLRDHAYALSTTLLRNDAHVIPLQLAPTDRLIVLSLVNAPRTRVEDRHYPSEFLLESVQHYHPRTDTIRVTSPMTAEHHERILQAARTATAIITVTVNANLDQQQAQLMQDLLHIGRPIIGIAAGNPYDLLAFPNLPTCLLTYEYTRPAIEAAVHVLFGVTKPQRHVPSTTLVN